MCVSLCTFHGRGLCGHLIAFVLKEVRGLCCVFRVTCLWLLAIDRCDVPQVCGPDPSKGGGVITRPILTSEPTPPQLVHIYVHKYTHAHTLPCWQEHKGAAATDVSWWKGEGYRGDINREFRSSVEFSVGLIVFSKDQDEGMGHVNKVSQWSLTLCVTMLLILAALCI